MHAPRTSRPLLATLTAALLATVPFACGQGIVQTWGSNYYGELGTGVGAQYVATPTVVGSFSGFTAVASGAGHSLAIRSGAVYAWGDNSFGQFGDGTTSSSSVPVAVSGLSIGVTAISAGQEHSLAIRDGALYAWGYNPSGQLGNGTTDRSASPVPVTGMYSGVTAISAGTYHSLAIKNGVIYAWGENSSGRLGDNSTAPQRTTPVAVYGLGGGVTAVSAGTNHSLAIQNGAAYAWGYNGDGELGDGSTTGSGIPVAVPTLARGVTAVAAGVNHSLAIQGGKVYAWGGNEEGQLGNNSTAKSSTPIQIDPADLHDIVAVAAGYSSSYALAADGSLWVWGRNSSGQLGLGNTTSRLTPQHLLPPSGYLYSTLDIEAVGGHVAALLAPVLPAFFKDEVEVGGNVYYLQLPNGNPFGYYAFLDDPRIIYHYDLGYEYLFDANDGKGGVYLYDFKSNSFFYTSQSFGGDKLTVARGAVRREVDGCFPRPSSTSACVAAANASARTAMPTTERNGPSVWPAKAPSSSNPRGPATTRSLRIRWWPPIRTA